MILYKKNLAQIAPGQADSKNPLSMKASVTSNDKAPIARTTMQLTAMQLDAKNPPAKAKSQPSAYTPDAQAKIQHSAQMSSGKTPRSQLSSQMPSAMAPVMQADAKNPPAKAKRQPSTYMPDAKAKRQPSTYMPDAKAKSQPSAYTLDAKAKIQYSAQMSSPQPIPNVQVVDEPKQPDLNSNLDQPVFEDQQQNEDAEDNVVPENQGGESQSGKEDEQILFDQNDGESSSDFENKLRENQVPVVESEPRVSSAPSLTNSQHAANFEAMQAEIEATLQASAQQPNMKSSQQAEGGYEGPR